MRYFHETTPAEREGASVAEIMGRFAQPNWCDYPEALDGFMGCWALLSNPQSISPAFCGNCDCCAIKHEPTTC